MTDKGIVVNTSPWIALSICGQIPLLEKLYTDVCIPLHVKEEIVAGGRESFGVYELEQGEAEVIILAKEKSIQLVLIDEKVARLQAKVLGLNVIGTLGVLLMAKKKGLLNAIKPAIAKILENGIWIRDEIVIGILKNAGEE